MNIKHEVADGKTGNRLLSVITTVSLTSVLFEELHGALDVVAKQK